MIKETPKTVTSLQNPIVHHLIKLRQSSRYRKEQKHVLIVGNKLVTEVCASVKPKRLILLKGAKPPKGLGQTPVLFVTEAILKKITALTSPEPMCAEVAIPKEKTVASSKKILVLDGVGDPGNLGTLARTALALNWDALFLLPNTVDPFNEKVIRSSKGALFRLPYTRGGFDELKSLITSQKYPVYIGDMGGKPVGEVKKGGKMMLILGNEAHGPQKETKGLGQTVCIPISQKMESLNVAVAGGILLYLLGESS